MTDNAIRAAVAASLLSAGLALSGCMSSPTYGTDKTSSEQLATDVSNILSLAPKQREPIDYKPRPELVKPSTTAVLPTPQESVTIAANPEWPESPEQLRARLRAEATANRDKPGFEPSIAGDLSAEPATPKVPFGKSARFVDSGIIPPSQAVATKAEFKKRLAENQQGSATSRKYLSEPPLLYRKPNETAPADDLGEDEFQKERRRKAEARKAAGGSSWQDLIPDF